MQIALQHNASTCSFISAIYINNLICGKYSETPLALTALLRKPPPKDSHQADFRAVTYEKRHADDLPARQAPAQATTRAAHPSLGKGFAQLPLRASGRAAQSAGMSGAYLAGLGLIGAGASVGSPCSAFSGVMGSVLT